MLTLKVPVEHRRVDVHERSPRAAHGIVDQHAGSPHVVLDQSHRCIDLRLIRHVANVSFCGRHLSGEIGEPLGVACQHRDAVATRSKAPDER